jgi:hypothetical protein
VVGGVLKSGYAGYAVGAPITWAAVCYSTADGGCGQLACAQLAPCRQQPPLPFLQPQQCQPMLFPSDAFLQAKDKSLDNPTYTLFDPDSK